MWRQRSLSYTHIVKSDSGPAHHEPLSEPLLGLPPQLPESEPESQLPLSELEFHPPLLDLGLCELDPLSQLCEFQLLGV